VFDADMVTGLRMAAFPTFESYDGSDPDVQR